MAEVNRWNPESEEAPVPNGEYVRYEDHVAAIQAAALAERRACAGAVCDGCRNNSVFDADTEMHGVLMQIPCKALGIRKRGLE